MNEKKLFFYIPAVSGGGTERVFTHLALLLSKKKKYSITYFYSINSYKDKKFINNSYIKFHKTFSKKTSLAIFEIIYFLWLKKPSVLITAQNNPNLLFSLIRIFLPHKTKIIISERSFTNLALDDASIFLRKIFNYLIPISYKNADLIHCITRRIADTLVNKYNIPKKKIIVIPNFVDIKNINAKAGENILMQSNESYINPYILSIGRLHNQKGFKYLITAFSSVIDKIPHKLIILGSGPLLDALKTQVRFLNLQKRVIFGGFIKNPYPILKKADLFILSSLYEGMPNALLEAIALNVPIISADCPSGPREILSQRYEHLLYKPTDTKKLSELIKRQIERPEIVSRSILEKEFSVSKVLAEYEKMINKDFK